MGLAADGAEEHAALLRLAAGGFRDMTRIASGHPDIWLDICDENRPAILAALDGLIGGLTEMRAIVERGRPRRPARPPATRPRAARSNLPGRITQPEQLAEVRIPIPDRMGAAAEIFTLAAEHRSTSPASRWSTWPRATEVWPWCWSTPRPPSAIAPRSPTRLPAGDHAVDMTVMCVPRPRRPSAGRSLAGARSLASEMVSR